MCLITAVIDFFWRVWECRGGGGQFSFNFPNVIGGRGKDGFTKLNFLEKFYLLKSLIALIYCIFFHIYVYIKPEIITFERTRVYTCK